MQRNKGKITNRQILYGNKYGIVIEEFKKLQSKYDKIKNDYDSLKQENADLIRRVGELETKRGRK